MYSPKERPKQFYPFKSTEDWKRKNSRTLFFRILNVFLANYQRNISKIVSMNKVPYFIKCQEEFKLDLSYLKNRYNITPHNHTCNDLYVFSLKLEQAMRESIQLIILENPDIRNMSFFRAKCLEDIVTHSRARDYSKI